MPSCSSDMPSSFSEQTMPSDMIPRILPGFSVLYSPESLCPSISRAPASASATFCPAAMFGAPVTTVRRCSPGLDIGQDQAVGIGMALHPVDWRGEDLVPAGAEMSIFSTSSPAMVSRCASSAASDSWSNEFIEPFERNSHAATLPAPIVFARELLQESKIVAGKRAHIVDAVAHHDHALDPETEGKSRSIVGVVADGSSTLRMDHAGAAHFQPAGVFADAAALAVADGAVDGEIDARLDEGEEVAAEADLRRRAEELARDLWKHALEIGHGDVLVDRQAFELMEHPLVRGILRFIAIGSGRARSPGPAATFCSITRACIGEVWVRRTISAPSRFDEEGVPDVAGRVIGGDVEQIEVVAAGFDFAPKDRLESHKSEDFAQLLDHLKNRMNDAYLRLCGRGG